MENGYVLFRAEGEDISGFLTLASEYELTIQKFCQSEGICFGYLPPSDYRVAARLGQSVGVRLQILEKNGVSFALYRYRQRLGLVVWPVVFLAALLFSQCFLWAVDVTGCENINEDGVRAAAAQLGLKTGLFLPNADLDGMAADLRRDFPGLAAVSFNRVGSRVEIALSESTPGPALESHDPCSLYAAKTGILREISVTRGQHQLALGQSVAEGQLLVSGITETPDGKISYERAAGRIMAETSHQKEFTLKLTQQEKTFTGEEQVCRSLDLFGQSLPLFLPDSFRKLLGQEVLPYESEITLAPLSFGKFVLPLGVVTEVRRPYTEAEKVFTEIEALAELNGAAEEYERYDLADAQVLGKEQSAAIADGSMTLTVTYTCLEDISEPRPLEIAP